MKIIPFNRANEENGWLSFVYPADFYLDNHHFFCVEQYMNYYKAVVFNDTYRIEKILKSRDIQEIRQYGKDVTNYIDKIWNVRRIAACYKGNLAKFQQNQDLKEKLLATGDTMIALVNKNDKIWGIGLNPDDSRIYNISKWDGLNISGYILMDVRQSLKD